MLIILSPLLLYLQQDNREEQTVLKWEEEIQHGPQKGEFMPRVSQSIGLQDTNHEKPHRLVSTEQPQRAALLRMWTSSYARRPHGSCWDSPKWHCHRPWWQFQWFQWQVKVVTVGNRNVCINRYRVEINNITVLGFSKEGSLLLVFIDLLEL